MSTENELQRPAGQTLLPAPQQARESQLATATARLETALRALSIAIDAAEIEHWSGGAATDAHDVHARWAAANLVLRGVRDTVDAAGQAVMTASRALLATG
jgi:hypothetical protein